MTRRLARLIEAVLLVLVVLTLSVAVGVRLLPASGHELVRITGSSMTPGIPIGSLVVLVKVAPTDLATGDIVSVRTGAGRSVVTHRIARLVTREGAPWLELRGDANEGPDPTLVPGTAVLGRVSLVIPGGGIALAIIASPAGSLVVTGTAGLLLAALLAARWVLPTAPAAPATPHPSGVP